ncbi:MAG: hypothetical protein KIT22_15865, partial [Verrucomicrobiae bacterium]|nr:hypothetical protein [Verrucomicrobiae bacterium]
VPPKPAEGGLRKRAPRLKPAPADERQPATETLKSGGSLTFPASSETFHSHPASSSIRAPRILPEIDVDTDSSAQWNFEKAGSVDPNLPPPAKRKNLSSSVKNQIPISSVDPSGTGGSFLGFLNRNRQRTIDAALDTTPGNTERFARTLERHDQSVQATVLTGKVLVTTGELTTTLAPGPRGLSPGIQRCPVRLGPRLRLVRKVPKFDQVSLPAAKRIAEKWKAETPLLNRPRKEMLEEFTALDASKPRLERHPVK